MADALRGSLVLTGQELRLRELTGNIGQGELRINMAYNLHQPDRSWFSIHLLGAEASQLLAPWPASARLVSGPLDLYLKGRLGDEWQGSGELSLPHGKIMNVDVDNWRLSFDIAFAPGYGNGHIEVRDSSGHIAQGRASVQATLSLGTNYRAEGQLRFTDVDLPTVLRQAADVSKIGMGKISGHVEFGGSDLGSLNELNATIEATLKQTQAFELPVLQQVAPFICAGPIVIDLPDRRIAGPVGPGHPASRAPGADGQHTEAVRGRNCQCGGPPGPGIDRQCGQHRSGPDRLTVAALRLPTVGPIPLGLLTDATGYLSNRAIHLKVLGTVHQPVIQVEPLRLLSQEGAYYFLSRAIP